jgi:prophage regulatory protein
MPDPSNLIARPFTMTDITVLTVAQATKEIGLSEPTMRRRAAADPAFPRKIKLSARRVGYLRRDIEAYLTRQREAATAS